MVLTPVTVFKGDSTVNLNDLSFNICECFSDEPSSGERGKVSL
jgi:hypothetical protein